MQISKYPISYSTRFYIINDFNEQTYKSKEPGESINNKTSIVLYLLICTLFGLVRQLFATAWDMHFTNPYVVPYHMLRMRRSTPMAFKPSNPTPNLPNLQQTQHIPIQNPLSIIWNLKDGFRDPKKINLGAAGINKIVSKLLRSKQQTKTPSIFPLIPIFTPKKGNNQFPPFPVVAQHLPPSDEHHSHH